MEESSPVSSKAMPETTSTMGSPPKEKVQETNQNNEVKVEEEDKPLPPSFHHTLTKEQLCDDDHPYVFWATIQILIPENPADLVATMFEYLKTFVNNMLEADAHFSVFLHNLSNDKALEALPEPLEDPDHILGEVEEWLEYFPGTQP